MSAALPAARRGADRAGVGAGSTAGLLAAALAWAGCALAALAVSDGLFLWVSGLGFAAAVGWTLWRSGSGGFDVGEVLPLFTLYYALSLLLRGVGLLTFVDSPYLRELDGPGAARYRDLVGQAFLVAVLGLVAAVAAYHSGFAARLAAAAPARLPALAKPWRGSRAPSLVLALVGIGLAGTLGSVRGWHGLAEAAMNPMLANTENALGFWWLIAVREFAVVGFHVHMIVLLLRRDRAFLAHYLVLGLALCVPLYLVSSSKFVLLRVLLLPWLFRHFVVRPVPAWKVLLGLAGFGALFPLLYAYRALGLFGLDRVGAYLEKSDAPLLLLFNRSYGTDSLMLVLHRVGDTVPLQWGRSLLDLLVFWIPRLLWPAKPDSFSLEFPRLMMPDVQWGTLTYVSSSLPGELFLDFHLPGVIAGSALLGVAMRAAYGFARSGPGGLLLYGFAYLTALHLVEGCIASQLETFLTHLVPCVIAIAWLTRGVPGPTPRESHA